MIKVNVTQSNSIQILRGLAIIAVVFIHNIPNELLQVFCRPFLNFSVGLFLFLSGMLSDASNWNPKKRIMKVVIPYIIWSLIYVILYNFKSPMSIPIIYLKRLVMGDAAVIMYYVFVYCEFTLLIPLIDKLAKSRYRYLGFLITPIEIVLMRLIPVIIDLEIDKYIVAIRSLSCLGWFTYYYFGYLVGNNIIKIKWKTSKLVCALLISIVLQIFEGYWYLSLGEYNCGTQLKLTAILTGTVFATIAYKIINSNKEYKLRPLWLLGNNSFGIYFSHLAVRSVLEKIPLYSRYAFYPIDAVIVVGISLCCVLVGKKILGKYSNYLGL